MRRSPSFTEVREIALSGRAVPVKRHIPATLSYVSVILVFTGVDTEFELLVLHIE